MSRKIISKKKSLNFYLFLASLIIPLVSYIYLEAKIVAQNTQKEKEYTKIKEIAESITFKIFPQDMTVNIGGSGVLIDKQNNHYYIITNNHVVEDVTLEYQIKSHQGNIYPVEIIAQNNQDSTVDDLALLKFYSETNYYPVKLSDDDNLSNNQLIIASGFPFDEKLEQQADIKYTIGNIKIILSQPLKGGYQFGYTNEINNGMSGGAILNMNGELIGINGLGKYPAIGNPYIYQNGAEINDISWDKMSEMSWGIPIKSIKTFTANLE
ncbi:peptidase S1 and S6 chymotrypsin/Hap [Cyanobacterium stanieri PCC 7202]|uniref:Peptidase S1 and S6 chymotrypsin/Hap n=1 Tax=Cyanobacterium stanieri (strain ATCC 29140 / PCC 7202) TaxID=292563 RepID=K9YJ09_CYASC|nr:peptidase S1 and S6 chymotrypsin/Hap [Cyanobacterium stanieri PCC 7202]